MSEVKSAGFALTALSLHLSPRPSNHEKHCWLKAEGQQTDWQGPGIPLSGPQHADMAVDLYKREACADSKQGVAGNKRRCLLSSQFLLFCLFDGISSNLCLTGMPV